MTAVEEFSAPASARPAPDDRARGASARDRLDPAERIRRALARAHRAADAIEAKLARHALLRAAVAEALEELDRIVGQDHPGRG